jgi:fumarate hydratase class II
MSVPPDRPDVVRWGKQTELAVSNFGRTGGPLPTDLIDAIVAIKAEAAMVNAEVGVVSGAIADAIGAAATAVLVGSHRQQFPVDVFQTGSGTSSNMNVNEVLAALASETAGTAVHPNDHVNASQSSNDVFPSAIRIAARLRIGEMLIPSLQGLHDNLIRLADDHAGTVKLGRTHLMDAVPMTFGQEVGGWARSVEQVIRSVSAAAELLTELPLGGTAVGTGINAPEGFAAGVIARLSARFGVPFHEALDHFEAQSNQDVLTEVSAACRRTMLTLHKIAGDIRLLGSGPTSGIGEVLVPDIQAGSSIMPGKVNPVIPEAVQQIAAQVVGHDAAITFAATLSTLQLNTAMPVMADNVLRAIASTARAAELLAGRCIAGLGVDVARMRAYADRAPSLVTGLAPDIGYTRAAELAHRMVAEQLTIEQVVRVELGDDAWDRMQSSVDPARMVGVEPPQQV